MQSPAGSVSLNSLTDEQLAGAKLHPRGRPGTWVAACVVTLVALQVIYSMMNNSAFGWDVVGKYLFSPQVLAGLATTILLTIASMTLASILGVIIAVSVVSRNPVLSAVAKAYIWFFRSIPLLVQIIFCYNFAALYPKIVFGIPFFRTLYEVDTNHVITTLSASLIALSLNESAFMAEIVRSGLASIDHGQREAARVLGMSSWATFRRIIMPQAMRVIIPPMGNDTIAMLKYTSLVSVIALPELLYSTQLISSRTFEVIPMLIVASIWYFVVTTILMFVQSKIETRFSRSVAT